MLWHILDEILFYTFLCCILSICIVITFLVLSLAVILLANWLHWLFLIYWVLSVTDVILENVVSLLSCMQGKTIQNFCTSFKLDKYKILNKFPWLYEGHSSKFSYQTFLIYIPNQLENFNGIWIIFPHLYSLHHKNNSTVKHLIIKPSLHLFWCSFNKCLFHIFFQYIRFIYTYTHIYFLT